MADRIVFESTDSWEDGAVFSKHEDGIEIAVAEEHAVDSYNHMFTCHAHLSMTDARRLRDWLNELLA